MGYKMRKIFQIGIENTVKKHVELNKTVKNIDTIPTQVLSVFPPGIRLSAIRHLFLEESIPNLRGSCPNL